MAIRASLFRSALIRWVRGAIQFLRATGGIGCARFSCLDFTAGLVQYREDYFCMLNDWRSKLLVESAPGSVGRCK